MDPATLIVGLLGSLLTAAGLFYTARQLKLTASGYRDSEKWKKTEFARQLIDKLATDDELAFCTRALDWAVGPLVIPAKHRVLFADSAPIMQHDLDLMYQSLRPDLVIGIEDGKGLTYRYSFDAFFSYLETIVHYITTEVLSRDELVGLEYYLSLVARPRYFEARGRPDAFRPFIQEYYPDLLPFIWPEPGCSPPKLQRVPTGPSIGGG